VRLIIYTNAATLLLNTVLVLLTLAKLFPVIIGLMLVIERHQ